MWTLKAKPTRSHSHVPAPAATKVKTRAAQQSLSTHPNTQTAFAPDSSRAIRNPHRAMRFKMTTRMDSKWSKVSSQRGGFPAAAQPPAAAAAAPPGRVRPRKHRLGASPPFRSGPKRVRNASLFECDVTGASRRGRVEVSRPREKKSARATRARSKGATRARARARAKPEPRPRECTRQIERDARRTLNPI